MCQDFAALVQSYMTDFITDFQIFKNNLAI